jgi:DNA-binding GntR family transcriptional regulator
MPRDAGSAVATVAATLREEILAGKLPGGAPVREHDVSKRLNVSRTPVREAVTMLVADGLLVKDDGRTAHVFRPSWSELLEIYEMRIPLESMAARMACQNADAAFDDEIAQAHTALVAAQSGPEWSACHEEFHLCLARGSRRMRLVSVLRTLRAQSEPYVRFAVTLDDDLRSSARRDHEEIVELVHARDPVGLESVVRRHLGATTKRVEALLQRTGQATQAPIPDLPAG